jgi:hypothetical protein
MPPSKKAKGESTTIKRTAPINTAFQRFADQNRRIRDVLSKAGSDKIPKSDNGVDMCLSWHIRGMCNTTCPRKADHRAHTAEEDNKLLEWCVRNFK